MTSETKVSVKPLLILDLDRTLIISEIITPSSLDAKEPETSKVSGSLDVETTPTFTFKSDRNYRLVKKRPGLHVFLENCSKHFNIGIWSASSKTYIEGIMDGLQIKAIMYLTIDHVSRGKVRKICSTSYVIVKPLTTIWEQYPEYNATNTYVVDDVPETYSWNVTNAVPIKPWKGEHDDKELERVWSVLDAKLKIKALRATDSNMNTKIKQIFINPSKSDIKSISKKQISKAVT